MTPIYPLASMNPLDHVAPHVLWSVQLGRFTFNISDHMLMATIAAALMLVVFLPMGRQRVVVRRGIWNFFEAICAFVRDEIAHPCLGDKADRYVPFIWTIFFFILFCDLLGMVPLGGILFLGTAGVSHHLARLGGTATANIWITGALASIAFIGIHTAGIREQGLRSYVKHFIPTTPWPLWFLLYPLELLGALVKPFALAIRLFANMVAGHTVLAAFLSLIFMARSYLVGSVTIVGCVALGLLEIFVAFLQAYIFTYLMTVFMGMAVHPDH